MTLTASPERVSGCDASPLGPVSTPTPLARQPGTQSLAVQGRLGAHISLRPRGLLSVQKLQGQRV